MSGVLSVLAPFVAAFLLAYLLEPLCSRLVRLGLPRPLATLGAMLLGLVMVLCMVLLGLPLLAREAHALLERMPPLLVQAYEALKPLLVQAGIPVEDSHALQVQLSEWAQERIGELSQAAWGGLKAGVGTLVTVIGWLVLVPVLVFFLVKDWFQILGQFVLVFSRKTQTGLQSVGQEIHETLSAYVQGQIRVMLCMALYYAAALLLAGFESWLALGILSGLLVAIPYLGFVLSLSFALVAGVLEQGVFMGLLLTGLVYGLGQVLEGFVLTPKLIGDRIGLHPLAVIFALLLFGSLLGPVGVLLALPLSAVCLVLARRFWRSSPAGRERASEHGQP